VRSQRWRSTFCFEQFHKSGALNGFRNGLNRGQPKGSDFGLTLLPESQSRFQGAGGGQ
jgi:hypothetical protein